MGHRESLVAGDIRDPSKKVLRKTVTKNTGSLYRGARAWERPGRRGKQQFCRWLNLASGKIEDLSRLMAS